LLRAAREWDVDTSRSYMIGDSERDAEAGRRAGCRSILIRRGHRGPASGEARDLREAAEIIVARGAGGGPSG
jgi:phosphoglycolate phosphatase-like HAD superfamily hydrolase